MIPSVIIVGAGGHARVLIDVLKKCSVDIIGIADRDNSTKGTTLDGVKVIGDDQAISTYSKDNHLLVNGVGSISLPHRRIKIFKQFKDLGYEFATVVHPSSVIASEVIIEEGVQIMAGSIVQPGCKIGQNSILNTRSSLDHDCVVGANVHIAPGVTISGGVNVGRGSHIGTGATIIQGVTIGENAVIGAGAVVLKNVPANTTVFGVPAKEVCR